VALAFWRWAITLALLLPLATPHVRVQGRLLTRGWPAVTVLGLFGIGGYNTLAYIAMQYTPATNALLLNACMPIAIRALSCAVLGTRLRVLESSGIVLACGGIATIVCRGDVRLLAHLTFNVGDLWMLAAVLTWALYTVGLHWRPAGVDPQLMLAAFIVVGLTGLAPAYAWEIWSGRVMHVTPGVLLALGYIGLCAGFLGFQCYNRGVREVGAHRAGVFLYLLPVFGTLLAALWLGERPQGYHYAGITLIFAGIWLTTVASHKVVLS
jgi:drug/metabolite transporter (DMT)-like permease